ncbi:MAG: hypothetical protein U0528_01405 [Anaerolineae bacterium]|nr:hypothetical protein [Anaerolineae bacterium]
MANIMVRVVSNDFDKWWSVVQGEADVLAQYGVAFGPLYRDVDNPNAALIHFIAEDLERGLAYFARSEFKEVSKRAGAISRDFYVAEKKG